MNKFVTYIMFICALVLVSCSKEDGDVVPPSSTTATLVSCDAPQWKCTDGVIPFGSMVLCMSQESLPQFVVMSKDDRLAAFMGDECLGVWRPMQEVGGNTDIILTVYEKDSKTDGSVKFELRYYNAIAKGYYKSELITFSSNQTLGLVSSPYKPVWK